MEKVIFRSLLPFIFLYTGVVLAPVLAQSEYGESYMTIEQSKKKFGSTAFVPEKFKAGNPKLKGEMAADLVQRKALVGKSLKQVRELLGPPDGYFQNDAIPAYIISPETGKRDTWQLVFIPNTDWTKVEEVKIHKNCCN